MRVALLTHNARAGDAIGNQVAEKVAFFRERAADVRVFLEDDQHLHPGVRAHSQRLPVPQPSGKAWEFISAADLVIVEYSQYYRLLELLPLLAREPREIKPASVHEATTCASSAAKKPRILFDYHGVTPPQSWPGHHRQALEKGAALRGLAWFADLALAHSEYMSGDLQQATGLPFGRLRILAHPLDTARFTPGAPRRHLAEMLHLGTARLLLYVGRVAPNKRIPLLVGAVARLQDVEPPVHLVIAGDTSDVYQAEAERCRQIAAEHGVASRVHLLGHVSDEQLLDAYRSADVFVMPSLHEGFCIPLVEAMACGVPVVATRATALPETVAGAGLTFSQDDVEDLADEIRRALNTDGEACPPKKASLRIAMVAFRCGDEFAGGAESSLSRIARTLHGAGHMVEIFTTCTQSESQWSNQLPEGTAHVDGIAVHRFRLDEHDRAQHLRSVRAILEKDGDVSPDVEKSYLRHSIHSSRLLDTLKRRSDEFDAILVGPYLYGLTYDVALAFKEKAILVPCFHDEPFARLKSWLPVYERVGGILYHSQAEKAFAEIQLGLSHPRSVCIGTVLDAAMRGNAEHGCELARSCRPYVLYCGRYSAQKNVPELVDFARRYTARHPERFTFVFLGEGEVRIPRAEWARDLGFVDEQTKHDVLAGAAVLVQLSRNESLSLVALEAWAQGTPVMADSRCAALAAHIRESAGGQAVAGFEEFATALDDVWSRPNLWRTMGEQGRQYVRRRYADRDAFRQTLEAALHGLQEPLALHMRRQGLIRAAGHDRNLWRERFGELLEEVLDAPSLSHVEDVGIVPRVSEHTAPAGQGSVLVPVRIANRGTHPLVQEGPARSVLRAELLANSDQQGTAASLDTPLPALLLPGHEISAVARVPVPALLGTYEVNLSLSGTGNFADIRAKSHAATLRLNVTPQPEPGTQYSVVSTGYSTRAGCCPSSLSSVHAALAQAANKQTLPDDYTDVTQGFLANVKRRIKRKLLGNFKHAYVDVLSRQQSTFNQHVLTALQELAECCALLDHARAIHAPAETSVKPERTHMVAWIKRLVAAGKADDLAQILQSLLDQSAANSQALAELEARLSRLEAGNLQ
ncbi:MAG TPA: glycosyltransferase family 4 protein, partial [Gemmataceae bacterium]|nr:glycosyltransferase family 4 protein [Gemmataceae bacterium]